MRAHALSVAAREAVLPARSPRATRAFAWYARRYCARQFSAVRVSRSGPVPADPGLPWIVYANHPSWWDPLLFVLLGDRFFRGREHYGVMDARALDKYPIFRRLGAFGVDRGSPTGALEFLHTARAVLSRPQATLWITPEGRFRDPRERPVVLESGLAQLAAGAERLALTPLAIEYPFWNERLPEALLRFGETIVVERGRGLGRAAWQSDLARSLETTLDGLAVEARSRDATRFRAIVAGRTGTGGIYELWGRAKALCRGRKFRPAHADLGP